MVVGITGASGAPIARAVLRGLHDAGVPVALVVSESGKVVYREECGTDPSELAQWATRVYEDRSFETPIASGSRQGRGMAIVPCSTNTLAKVALGLTDTLISRAAHVQLKERRPLVLVPRETPLSAIQLQHMSRLAELGVVILPATPAYYTHPSTVQEMTDFVAGRVLDQFGVPHSLYRGYRAGAE